MPYRRKFSAEFKTQVVMEMLSGAKSQAEAARQHQIKPDILARWKAEFVQRAPSLFRRQEHGTEEQARIADLERMVGKLVLELEVTKKASSMLTGRQDRSEGRR